MTDRATSPLASYRATVALVQILPTPRQISHIILASTEGAHNGLGATRYDTERVTGGEHSSHPDRMAERRIERAERAAQELARTGRDRREGLDDLRTVSKASERFVVAIASLLVESQIGDPGDMDDYDWDEAVTDAALMAELQATEDGKPGEVLQAAIDCYEGPVLRHITNADRAVRDLALVLRLYSPRDANDLERSWTSGLADEDCCRYCLRLGLRVERHRRDCCQVHYRLEQDSRNHTTDGQIAEVPDWLTETMLRTKGPGPLWRAERSRWLLSLGPERRTA